MDKKERIEQHLTEIDGLVGAAIDDAEAGLYEDVGTTIGEIRSILDRLKKELPNG